MASWLGAEEVGRWVGAPPERAMMGGGVWENGQADGPCTTVKLERLRHSVNS